MPSLHVPFLKERMQPGGQTATYHIGLWPGRTGQRREPHVRTMRSGRPRFGGGILDTGSPVRMTAKPTGSTASLAKRLAQTEICGQDAKLVNSSPLTIGSTSNPGAPPAGGRSQRFGPLRTRSLERPT